MTQQAAALQTYNNELVKCIEDLCSKRDELNSQIKQEEEERERLEHDIHVLSEKLSRVNKSLEQRLAARATFDRTIAETEAAYTKILESSQSLLSVLKQEAGNLSKATEPRRREHYQQ
ncbi:Sjoegren syndrome nuclear autoantigen 1 [Cololabis saira]|uniref:Sjoegren syndrome nuclear autoantigen 1 n=1 Tax=Cololabis saira TaxID=129043 RepID=UPI002AD35952|nr:Sjoegren syndrome nuclear autoantigen 1 [Cololabis saira]